MSDLTIEQMRQIVDGAPDWAKGYNTAIQKYTRSVWFSKDILLSDIKAQIDQCYYGQSEEKELEQYAILSQEKIEGGAVLVGGLSIQKMVDYQDVVAKQQSEIDQLKAEHRKEKIKCQRLSTEISDIDGYNAIHKKEIEKLKAENLRLSGLLKEQKRCFDECSQMVSDLIKERDQLKAEKAGFEKQERINAECIKNLVKQKADYLHKVTMATAHLDSFDHSNAGMNKLVRSIESALEALRDECD